MEGQAFRHSDLYLIIRECHNNNYYVCLITTDNYCMVINIPNYVCKVNIMSIIICNILCTGADPEILHGRWLMGWLPIVNHTGARGWLIDNVGCLQYYVA